VAFAIRRARAVPSLRFCACGLAGFAGKPDWSVALLTVCRAGSCSAFRRFTSDLHGLRGAQVLLLYKAAHILTLRIACFTLNFFDDVLRIHKTYMPIM